MHNYYYVRKVKSYYCFVYQSKMAFLAGGIHFFQDFAILHKNVCRNMKCCKITVKGFLCDRLNFFVTDM